jgi:D-tyrosyl-tRNA(Tyr) deacylase
VGHPARAVLVVCTDERDERDEHQPCCQMRPEHRNGQPGQHCHDQDRYVRQGCRWEPTHPRSGSHGPECGASSQLEVKCRLAASAVMRVLVQRVTSASVTVDGDVVGAISPDGQGLLALVGVTHSDDDAKAERMAEKLWQLRILDDEKSASDVAAPILVVSQFTLYANTAKGRRPTWNAAAPGAVAEPLVIAFAEALQHLGAQVQTGLFGAHMQVQLVNDGPVTVLLEL